MTGPGTCFELREVEQVMDFKVLESALESQGRNPNLEINRSLDQFNATGIFDSRAGHWFLKLGSDFLHVVDTLI